MMIDQNEKHWRVAVAPDGHYRFELREAGEVIHSTTYKLTDSEAKQKAIRLGDKHQCGVIFNGIQ
jgi:hypothetical protein